MTRNLDKSHHEFPRILKADKIIGHKIEFHNASIEDAEFILSLRTDPLKGKHLSSISGILADQRKYLEGYENSTGTAYFIVHLRDGGPIGTVRIYDAREDSFCWGSWIIRDDAPSFSAIESALIVYDYAIEHLKFSKSHFDVRKENSGVWRFHERFGARRLSEDSENYYYQISGEDIRRSKKRYGKYLPNGVQVVTPLPR